MSSVSNAKAYGCITVDADGFSFKVIYGAYENGYFCAIPNHGICCDMSSPTDTFYNTEALQHHGISSVAAKHIAAVIKDVIKI